MVKWIKWSFLLEPIITSWLQNSDFPVLPFLLYLLTGILLWEVFLFPPFIYLLLSLFIVLCISIDSWFPFYWKCYVIIRFDAHIVLGLASRNCFRLVPVSYWCTSLISEYFIILWNKTFQDNLVFFLPQPWFQIIL